MKYQISGGNLKQERVSYWYVKPFHFFLFFYISLTQVKDELALLNIRSIDQNQVTVIGLVKVIVTK